MAIAYTIVISPMWNAYTDAYVKGDYDWIRVTHKRALWVWVITIIGGLFMLAIAGIFYKLWIGDSIYYAHQRAQQDKGTNHHFCNLYIALHFSCHFNR